MARQDLEMNAGKLCSQIGHAFHYSVRNKEICNSLVDDYENPEIGGSKVCLWANDEIHIHKIHHEIQKLGVPCALVVDSQHVHPPFFDGSPIVTALGVGPCTKRQVKRVLGKLKLIK
ncbi:aminoacyl-tRNA hydrolase [Vibrio parahaemolyticus]|uniref:aminoacyl-tRNA hydrolase n=1 Tax=Vibrio parahaemolyticus TaxID=670 RepID=UPI00344FF444